MGRLLANAGDTDVEYMIVLMCHEVDIGILIHTFHSMGLRVRPAMTLATVAAQEPQ